MSLTWGLGRITEGQKLSQADDRKAYGLADVISELLTVAMVTAFCWVETLKTVKRTANKGGPSASWGFKVTSIISEASMFCDKKMAKCVYGGPEVAFASNHLGRCIRT